MKKKNIFKINELGSMMVEALAMLGLISMVTPVVYKKAAERNSEMQDVNSAAQLRTIVRAVDEYIQDNYSAISAGDVVSNSCKVPSVNYSAFKATGPAHRLVDIRHLCDYLPYGFLSSDGEVSSNKIFSSNYKLSIKKTDGINSQKTLTGFLVAQPNMGATFPKIRASRISSMIGGNGGYIETNKAYGVQGMWEVANVSGNLGISGVTDGSIITTSAQPISSGKANYDEVLHRVHKEKRELNTMETSLLMGRTGAHGQNIENVNRIIITAENSTPSGASTLESGWQQKALWVSGNDAGAYIDGMLQSAKGSFSVDKDANVIAKGALSAADNKFIVGLDGNFTVDKDGNTAAKGTLSAANSKFTVAADGSLKASDSKFTVAADGSLKASDGEFTVDNKGATVMGKAYNAADTSYKLRVNGNAFIAGFLRLTKLKADTVDAGTLKAGTTNVMSDNRQDYTLYTDSARLVVGATGAADNVGVFNVERAGYTYAKGLRAGLVNGSLYPFNVGNDANSNIVMRLRTTSSTISARNVANTQNLLYVDNSSASMQGYSSDAQLAKVTVNASGIATLSGTGGGNVSEVYLNNDQASMGVGTASGANRNLTVYKAGSTITTVPRPQVWVRNGTDLKVLNSGGDVVLNVDQSSAMKDVAYTETTNGTSRGSVYVRKGVVELASNHGQNPTNPSFSGTNKDMGYVKGDMLVAQKTLDNNATLSFNEYYGGTAPQPSEKYNMFMVNPAYTSVMHDIKLTSRGGARLSDILPDFVNKGIYLADNTFLESAIKSTTIWKTNTTSTIEGIDGKPTPGTATPGDFLASAWLGVVPAPQCPPGYNKVISAVPMSFKMAEASTVWDQERAGAYTFYQYKDAHEQITGFDNPYFPGENHEAIPLTFQKNTFLKVSNVQHGDKTAFKGWSILMGFIYPMTEYGKTQDPKTGASVDSSYYKKYASKTLQNNANKYVWNLYPVYPNTLESLITVYCYFDRGQFKNGTLVDRTYDQLLNFRPVTDKSNTGYTDRLNDPKLKYNDVW